MNKIWALFFSTIGVILMVSVGITLGNEQYLLALLLFIAIFIWVGFGFFVKAKMSKKEQGSS